MKEKKENTGKLNEWGNWSCPIDLFNAALNQLKIRHIK